MKVEAELEAAREDLAAATLSSKLYPESGAAGDLHGNGCDGGAAEAGGGVGGGRFSSMIDEGRMSAALHSLPEAVLEVDGTPDQEMAVQQLKAVRSCNRLQSGVGVQGVPACCVSCCDADRARRGVIPWPLRTGGYPAPPRSPGDAEGVHPAHGARLQNV